jgi:hypothetical protein
MLIAVILVVVLLSFAPAGGGHGGVQALSSPALVSALW